MCYCRDIGILRTFLSEQVKTDGTTVYCELHMYWFPLRLGMLFIALALSEDRTEWTRNLNIDSRKRTKINTYCYRERKLG